MKIKGVDFSFKQVACLMLYYGIARFLPNNRLFLGGG